MFFQALAEEEEGEENIDDEEDEEEEEEEKGDPAMSKGEMIVIEEENSSEEKMYSALKWGRLVPYLMSYLILVLYLEYGMSTQYQLLCSFFCS